MNTEIEKTIKALSEKAASSVQPHEAMQLTQAALNLAHTAQIWTLVKKS